MGSMKDMLGDEPYANRYPVAAGFKVTGTSQEAARKVTPRLTGLRSKVMDALRAGDKTADEVAEFMDKSVLSVRPRLSELREMGLIEPTGARRHNESGMTADVWRIKP